MRKAIFNEFWRCPLRKTDVYLGGGKYGPYCSISESKRLCFGDNFPDWCPLEEVE